MSRVSVPKYKIDRTLGVNLWGRPKSPNNTRPYRPGQHGKSARRKLSNFALQLSEKQKLQFYYGMKEKQFRKFFATAQKAKGNVVSAFIAMLERRLDSFVYRMKWGATIFASKQLVKHKHVLVNGRRVFVSSYLLNPGDVVTLVDTMKDHSIVKEALALQEREIPTYYEVEHNGVTGKMIKLPEPEEVPYPIEINPQLIVEYYSRRM